MNLLEQLMAAQGGSAMENLGKQFGLESNQAQSAVTQLLPFLAGGLQRNLSQEGGLESLLGALAGGGHQRYVEDPEALGREESIRDGNGILGHLLGNKDVSRQVASRASAQTGIGSDVLKQMLPVVATMVMGTLSKQASASNLHERAASDSSGVLGMLTPMLDRDGDGSAVDDVMGMLGKFMSR